MTPEQRAQFISNVPDAEQRREAEKLWQASYSADTEFAKSCVDKGVLGRPEPGTIETTDMIEAEFNAAVAADPELAALRDAAELARGPWIACAEYGDPLECTDGEIIRCALTGFLVHENDKFLIDLSTHECVLKTALGIPLGFIVGEFRTDDAPPVALADDALSIAEAVG
jgi:hypothetical protein